MNSRSGLKCSAFGVLLGFLLLGARGSLATTTITEGRTAGHFAVSATGSAAYSIPIWAPPGPRGIQPHVSLAYNSRSGNGSVGVGWAIAGLGAITRCNKTYAQDTTPSAVTLTTSDGLCINGSRLRLTSGTYGETGSVYQTEIADFSQVTANGTAGSAPSYFTVQGRNGLTYYYGYTDSNGNGANSEVLASGTSTPLTWLLSKVIDRAGNNYVINYTALTGTAVPNTIMWTPVSAGASTYVYKMQFNYGTNAPQSSFYGYIAGTAVSNAKLLSSIAIYVSGTIVKNYILSYTPSGTTQRDELTSVQECADANTPPSNCLLPTTISYQNGTVGVSSTATTAVSSIGSDVVVHRDFNGDGYEDLLYSNGTTMYVAFGSASGFGTPVSTGITEANYIVSNDLLGTGSDGLLVNHGGTLWYYTWNGSSFVGVTTGTAYSAATNCCVLADTNGDGLPDLVTYTLVPSGANQGLHVFIQLNTSSGSTPSFSSTVNDAYDYYCSNCTPGLWFPEVGGTGPLRSWDFNGDGRQDLAFRLTLTSGRYFLYELLANGTTFTATEVGYTDADAGGAPPYVVDWNNDSCGDAIWNNTIWVSGCDGSSPSTYPISGTILTTMDWDGDGRTDIIVANGSTLGVYLSTGDGLSSLQTTTIPYTSTCAYFTADYNGDGLDDLGCWSQTSPYPVTYRLHNGAGTPADLATSFTDGYGNSASPSYVSIVNSNYTENPSAGPAVSYPDQLYVGPLYVVSDVVFSDPSAVAGTFNQAYNYYEAWSNLQGRGFEGFWSVKTSDSRQTSQSPPLYQYTYYEQQFPWTGMEFEALSTTGVFYPVENIGTPNTLSQATLSSTANEQRYFPYFTNWTTYQKEVNGTENGDLIKTASTNYTYDNYGNATNVTTTVTDGDPGSVYTGNTWTTAISNTTDISVNQSTDLAAWCLNMLEETQVAYSSTASNSTSVTRTKTFTLDTPSACRIKGSQTEPSSSLYKVTDALTFDSFGNVATDTVTGVNMPSSPASRETHLNWGTTGQFLNYLIDPSGAQTTWSYTSNQALTYGVPDSLTDPNSTTTNPIVTAWTYDAYGRKQLVVNPDGTQTKWVWTACTSHCSVGNSVYQIQQTAYQTNGTTVIRADTNLYDPVDRVTQTSGPTVDGKTGIVQMQYNSLGLLYQQSIPYLSTGTEKFQTYAYDVLNRVTSVSRPISSTNSTAQSTLYAYTGDKTVITDPVGNSKTLINDSNGWLRKTTDAIGSGYTITKYYDAAGTLTKIIDSVGNTLLANVTVAYGIKPFVTAASDADRGAWTYTFDSLGEQTSWTDQNGNRFYETFDSLSRPLTRTEPDLFTQWNYGTASPNLGKLTSECTQTESPCGSSSYQYYESRSYDTLSRPSTSSISEYGNTGGYDASGSFKYTLGYSTTTGQLSTVTYPKSSSSYALELTYGYQNGLLYTVTDSTDSTAICGTSCTLWTANTMDAFGHVLQETIGNGVVANRTYDAVTSWLTSATAGVGGGAGLLNQSYLQDKDGNVTQRQMTSGTTSLTENLYYDADNRVCAVVLGGTGSCSTGTFVYDGGSAGPGNITSQAGVGTYVYPTPGSSQPHAVTSITGTFNGITNPPFSYDGNGNMTARASSSQNIYWYTSNYPSSITGSDATGTEQVQFNYGPDRARWEQIYTGPSGVETTFYVGKRFEVVVNGSVTDYRHYIYAGSTPIAVYSRTSAGTNTMRYALDDHQGGVATVLSNAGVSDINESFTAFGQRRNPTTWSGAPSTGDLNTIAGISRQGYTFQTWLGQSMGLNHMNGRVQDAILGRFLSPDPHVPDPSDAQSYNRYSYVNNNPLTMTDPSGFFQEPPKRADLDDQYPIADYWSGGSVQGLTGINADFANFGLGGDMGGPITWQNGQYVPASGSVMSAGGSGVSTNTNGSTGGSSTGGNLAAAPVDTSSAQSQTPIDMTPSADGLAPVVVLAGGSGNAIGSPFPYQYGQNFTGGFKCGNGYCTYNLYSYRVAINRGFVGAFLKLTYKGEGGKWLTTYTSSDYPGVFQPPDGIDPSDPFFSGNGTTSNVFLIQTGTNEYGTYLAQVSLVQPNGSGGYSAAFTVEWGWNWGQDGAFQPIRPQILPIWSTQSQNIGLLH